MGGRRILSVWFPRLPAERVARQIRGTDEIPVAIVDSIANRQVIVSITAAAESRGVHAGQSFQDAAAIFSGLVTRPADKMADAAFLSSLRRSAEQYSPWVAEDENSGLILDFTGCAHLFGGEERLLSQVEGNCASYGLTAQAGIADTVGAAWALARFAGHASETVRTGDDIDQEARATRSRSSRRHSWASNQLAPDPTANPNVKERIAPPGTARAALAPLPVAALRLPKETVVEMLHLGIRKIEDLMTLPRPAFIRRFGLNVFERLDQALGCTPEPVSPVRPAQRYAARLTLPNPTDLEEDIMAGVDRLLPPICKRLRKNECGMRRVRLELRRTDNQHRSVEIGLAQPSNSEEQIRDLIAMRIGDIDPGSGIDVLRMAAKAIESVSHRPHKGWRDAAENVRSASRKPALEDLINRIGTRIGLEAITRFCPADSNIPEKTAAVHAAAWSKPVADWPMPDNMRPAFLFRPEPVFGPDSPKPPMQFRWRQCQYVRTSATGPERIMPEWWLDDPNWRSGTRDYWRVETSSGKRLWLFYAHGGANSPGWFCHGEFA